jgi:hypothetical protein
MKMKHPQMMVVRRPNQSARSPAIKAPKNVPADRIETMSDFLEAGTTKSVSGVVAGSYSRSVEVSGCQIKFTHETLILLNEVVHSQNTGDITRVISEEDTTKGSKGTHQVGLECDRSLDTHGVRRRGDDSTTRHGKEMFKTKSKGVIKTLKEVEI